MGIIAAQSIGEPGTQLTMRTFHTGGVAGADITHGLPRVVELFEARKPKGLAKIAEQDGAVSIEETDKALTVVVTDDAGEEHRYPFPRRTRLFVENGEKIEAGKQLNEGSLYPHELLALRGRTDTEQYLVKEVQEVYKSQGVDINDKHIELIVRQMLKRVRVDQKGDTDYLPGQFVDRNDFFKVNAEVKKNKGEQAQFEEIILGITKASLNTDSFLSAASFQETTKVLTDAALEGKKDTLNGLKENVIIGKLIPAATGLKRYRRIEIEPSEPLPARDRRRRPARPGRDRRRARARRRRRPGRLRRRVRVRHRVARGHRRRRHGPGLRRGARGPRRARRRTRSSRPPTSRCARSPAICAGLRRFGAAPPGGRKVSRSGERSWLLCAQASRSDRVAVGMVPRTLRAAALLLALTPAAAAARPKPIQIKTLSNRADLISDGQALVQVKLPKGANARRLHVALNGATSASAFKRRANGRIEGVVDGLKLGANQLVATAPHATGARLTITNHPNGGPVFSGPQVQPWQCQQGAVDEQCNKPRAVHVPVQVDRPDEGRPAALRPRQAARRRRDDHDRRGHHGAVHRPPGARLPGPRPVQDPHAVHARQGLEPLGPQRSGTTSCWSPAAAAAAPNYGTGSAPLDDLSGTLPTVPGYTQSYINALGRGFAVMSTALDNTGHNCNLATEAESLIMAKERLSRTTATCATRSAPAARAARSCSRRWRTPTPAPSTTGS